MPEVKDIDFENDVIVIKMEVNQLPAISLDRNGSFIKWGVNNDYPEKTVIHAYNNHPAHRGIVKGKARYISGKAIIPSIDNPDTKYFLSRANSKESFHALGKKVSGDKVLYGGFAVQVTPNALGRPVEWFQLDVGKLRPHENKKGYWYSQDWSANRNDLRKTYYPSYYEGCKEISIYFHKDHGPSVNKLDSCLPTPEYLSVLLDIDTDIEISNFFNMLVKNGFSAGHIITFFNGKFTPEKKKEIEERFQSKFNGTDNAGKVVIVFTNPDGKGTQVTNITPNGLSEQYDVINKRNKNNIVSGHDVPRALFKIETEGSLGDRTVLDLQHEQFINEYAKIEQDPFNIFLKKMYKASRGIDCDFTIQQVDPIGKQFPIDNALAVNALNARDPNIYTNLLIKMFGIEVPLAEVSQDAQATSQMQEGVNKSFVGLTARQRDGLRKVSRDFSKKRITDIQAEIELGHFGFNPMDAKKYLGIAINDLQVQQAKHESILAFVKLNTVEVNEEFGELVDSRPFNIQFKDEDFKKDFKKEDGNLVPKKGFIEGLIDSFRKKININKYDTVVKTVYKYDLRPELKAKGEQMFIATSRDRCYEFADMTSGNKRLTFEAIDALENDMETDNTNAWDYSGGFWGKKKKCRHVWLAETYIEKIKK